MATKMFCDGCGKQTSRNYAFRRLKTKLKIGKSEFMAEVQVATNATWNGGEICRACLMKVLSKGEEIGK